MPHLPGEVWALARETVAEFFDDECFSMSASLAFYTMFSLAPAVVIVIQVASLVIDPAAVRGEIDAQVGALIGEQAAEQVQTMVREAQDRGAGGPVGRALGVGALLVGATAVLAQLQSTLNKAWEVRPNPARPLWGNLRDFLFKRLLSFGMLLGIAFLLLTSLTLSAVVAALGERIALLVPGLESAMTLEIINQALSLLVFSLLFGAMFKFLPDAEVGWRDVAVGAVVTAVLFVVGKALIGLYLGSSGLGTAYGAASALAIILVWVYYSSLVLFVGAEFTQVWARRRGREIVPARGAVRVIRKVERLEGA